jgi:hypothetical protein
MPAEIHASVVRLRSAAEAAYRHIHTRTGDPEGGL